MKYVPPLNADNEQAPYINGDPSTGQQGSMVPAQAVEHPQREIIQAIKDAGLTPDADDLTQLSKAISGHDLEQAILAALAKEKDPSNILAKYIDITRTGVMVNSMTLFLNQVNGSDNNDGETIDKPLKTLDQALRIAAGRTWKLTIKCLSNITLKKIHGFNHDLTLVGIDSTGKATERQITSIGEAENSPVADGGRFFGSLHSNAGVMIFLQYFTIKLPSAVNTSINYPSMFITGSSIALRFSNCHFDGSAARAGTFFMHVGVRSDVSFYRATFQNHLGRMVQGYTNTAGTNVSDIKKLFIGLSKV